MSPTTPVARRPRGGVTTEHSTRTQTRTARDLGGDRDRRNAPGASTKTRHRPNPVRRIVPKPAPGRLGSRQVVSVRGRRVSTTTDRRFGRVSLVAILVLVVGVVGAMLLSGQATQQTFKLQQLSAVEGDLQNQIETAQRDLEGLRSSAGLTDQARRDNLVRPEQAGVLGVEENGDTREWRPAGEGSLPIINVNEAPSSGQGASSKAEETRGMADQLEPRPPRAPDTANRGSGTVPYQDSASSRR